MKKSKLSAFGRSSTGRQFKIKKYPNFDEEKKCWRRGCKIVVGLDEAGRGPLAGPVVASAIHVLCHPGLDRGSRFWIPAFAGMTVNKIRDSKKLSARQREEWYKILTKHPGIKWGVGIVPHTIIDQINIFEATKLAMKKAINNLQQRPCRVFRDREIHDRGAINDEIDFLIIDGNFVLKDLSIAQKAIIRGDERVFSCAAASIIAKVTRDRIMVKYAKKYPQYGFDKHKGYGTRQHFEAIRKHGPCKIHRRSFRPLR